MCNEVLEMRGRIGMFSKRSLVIFQVCFKAWVEIVLWLFFEVLISLYKFISSHLGQNVLPSNHA